MTQANEKNMANAIRALSMDAVQAANSGHPGMPMGMADAATVLFNRFINIDPANPNWPDRDRFVLSAGHGSMLLYSMHHLLGYSDMDIDQIRNFRQMGYRTAGHPEYGHADGIETTTGPLGQGISTAVGMALAERLQNARFGDDLIDHWTYVIAGDGCLMEGISHEAIDMAGHLGLGKLVVLWDDNSITIDGATDMSTSTDQAARFAACGWHTVAVDGHDADAVAAAIEAARADGRPSLIACKTVIGFGSPHKAGTSGAHGAPLGADEIVLTRAALGWEHAAFEVPDAVYSDWHAISARGAGLSSAWNERLAASRTQAAFNEALSGADREPLTAAMAAYKTSLIADKPKVATRKSSQMALEIVNGAINSMVGGSADLTGSNLTRTSAMTPVSKSDYSGNYIYYGVREHGMAAAMNGLQLHGGLRAYGGTFLAFADYCRGSIRLSALMGIPVTYVMTHDSIGLGEDGPTHQPVEQVASLRVMPNLNVFRPCDAVETAEAWEIAVNSDTTPSLMALSRQGLPLVRTDASENMTAKGMYVLREANGARDVTLLATGSEVEIALAAADALAADGINAAVVSAPCFELFDQQDKSYRASVLGSAPRVAVEAGVVTGWEKYLGENSAFIGMSSFGASAPINELYQHFGITSDATVVAAKVLINV
ncbi:MAG: transketolase [Paracoccaceae bacterium]|jgi:transketolase